MTSDALFGFAGVILGSLTTSMLTIYRERITGSRERLARREQYERERTGERNTFQRESILALQSAVSDLIRAAYAELDRVLAEIQTSEVWTRRRWETPTAVGWSDAILRLESSRARVFDDRLRALADELRTLAGDSVWAEDLESAKQLSQRLEPLQRQFNERVTTILPSLY